MRGRPAKYTSGRSYLAALRLIAGLGCPVASIARNPRRGPCRRGRTRRKGCVALALSAVEVLVDRRAGAPERAWAAQVAGSLRPPKRPGRYTLIGYALSGEVRRRFVVFSR